MICTKFIKICVERARKNQAFRGCSLSLRGLLKSNPHFDKLCKNHCCIAGVRKGRGRKFGRGTVRKPLSLPIQTLIMQANPHLASHTDVLLAHHAILLQREGTRDEALQVFQFPYEILGHSSIPRARNPLQLPIQTPATQAS